MTNTHTIKLLYIVRLHCKLLHYFSGYKCPSIGPIEHGDYTLQKYPGWPQTICNLRFTCRPGYLLIGRKHLYCLDSKWSAPAPKCQGKYLYVSTDSSAKWNKKGLGL